MMNPFYYKLHHKKRIIAGVLCAVLIFMLFMCGFHMNTAHARDVVRVEIAFDEEELAYIAQEKEIRIVNFVTRAPVSYEENGELQGIVVDIMRWIEANTGLCFNYMELPAGANPIDYITEGNADVASGVLDYGENRDNPDIMLTDPVFTCDAALVAKRGAVIDMGKSLNVFVPKGYRMGYQYLTDTYPNYNIKYADSTEAALKALQEGRADLVFQNVYVLDEYLKRPSYRDLVLYKSSVMQEELVCAVVADEDPVLVDIMNKAIAAMPEEYTRQLIVDYTITRMYYPTISEQIANNPMLFIAIAVIILVLIVIVILSVRLLSRSKMMRLMSQNEEYLKNITNNINGGLVMLTKKDGSFQVAYANDKFWNVVAGEKEVLQKTDCHFVDFVCDKDKERVAAGLQKAWVSGDMVEIKFGLKGSSQDKPILLNGGRNSDLSGRQNITCVLIDFSREQRLKESLEEEKEMYRLFMEDSRDIVFYCDIKTHEYIWPPFYEERFGIVPPRFVYDGEEEEAFGTIFEKEDLPLFIKALNTLKSSGKTSDISVRLKTAEGYRWHRVKLSSMEKKGKVYRTLGRMTDIDKEVNRMQQLSDASMRDKLTGLYNKNSFYALVNKYIENAGKKAVLLFFDLDNFKSVNDQMGHLTGDEILINVAGSMKHIFRSDDIVARFGGDEFIIFVKESDEKVALVKIQNLKEEILRIKQECHAENTGLSACIGVSMYPDDALDVEQLVAKADSAMYYVKEHGKNGYAFYRDVKNMVDK